MYLRGQISCQLMDMKRFLVKNNFDMLLTVSLGLWQADCDNLQISFHHFVTNTSPRNPINLLLILTIVTKCHICCSTDLLVILSIVHGHQIHYYYCIHGTTSSAIYVTLHYIGYSLALESRVFQIDLQGLQIKVRSKRSLSKSPKCEENAMAFLPLFWQLCHKQIISPRM